MTWMILSQSNLATVHVLIMLENCENLCLVGGFNPSEKYQSKWESSPNRGENNKYLKPPVGKSAYVGSTLPPQDAGSPPAGFLTFFVGRSFVSVAAWGVDPTPTHMTVDTFFERDSSCPQ